MIKIAHSAHDMICGMTPVLQPGEFVFVTTTDPVLGDTLAVHATATFREAEGLSLLIPRARAEAANLIADVPMRCITLNVFSSLEGVGLTAAVSAALGAHDIPCNMVAAYHHDHVFVPAHQSALAMQVLLALQNQAATGD